jgi:hypothetical protein
MAGKSELRLELTEIVLNGNGLSGSYQRLPSQRKSSGGRSTILKASSCLCLFEWQKFGCRNEKFREATVQADQNTLANIEGRNLQVLRTRETDCKLPIQLLHVPGIANFTSHCNAKSALAISTLFSNA